MKERERVGGRSVAWWCSVRGEFPAESESRVDSLSLLGAAWIVPRGATDLAAQRGFELP